MKSPGWRRVFLTILFLPVFLAVSIPKLPPPAYAAPAKAQQPSPSTLSASEGSSSLSVPEDALGQRSESQIPEISIQVDVRDGHLVVRVVDLCGPGRVPLVVRSWTGVGNSPSGAGPWQFNQHRNASADSASATVLEPDGNPSTYRFLQRIGTTANPTFVYVKDVGVYSTFEAPAICEVCNGEVGCGPTICYLASGGNYTVRLPKGVIHRYSSGLISQEQDANENSTTFAFTSLPEQNRYYVATVTDPVGRATTYGYEAIPGSRVCVQGER